MKKNHDNFTQQNYYSFFFNKKKILLRIIPTFVIRPWL